MKEEDEMLLKCPICKEGRIPNYADDEPVASSSTFVHEDHSGSTAALLKTDSASEEDGSGLAADGQEEGKDKGKGKKEKGKARAWSEVKCRDCNQWHLWPECPECGVLMAAQVLQWSCACCQQTITEQDRGKDKGDNKSKAQREWEAFQEIERQRIEWEQLCERQQALWEAGVDSLPPLPARPSIYHVVDHGMVKEGEKEKEEEKIHVRIMELASLCTPAKMVPVKVADEEAKQQAKKERRQQEKERRQASKRKGIGDEDGKAGHDVVGSRALLGNGFSRGFAVLNI